MGTDYLRGPGAQRGSGLDMCDILARYFGARNRKT